MTESVYIEADVIRNNLAKLIPYGGVIPEHTPDGHHYRVMMWPNKPLLDSVTTKLQILDKGYLKNWSVGLGIDHIRKNWKQALVGPAEWEKILQEAEHMHANVLEDAQDIGTEIHAIIEKWINDWIAKRAMGDIKAFIPAACDTRIIAGCLSAQAFCRDSLIIPVRAEMLVASKDIDSAGTLDLLALMPNPKKTTYTYEPFSKTCKHEWHCTEKYPLHVFCVLCEMSVWYELGIIDWKSSNSILKAEYILQAAAYGHAFQKMSKMKIKTTSVVRLNKTFPDYEIAELVPFQARKAIRIYRYVSKIHNWLKSPDSKFPRKERKVMKV